jgi:hypothetical protein
MGKRSNEFQKLAHLIRDGAYFEAGGCSVRI